MTGDYLHRFGGVSFGGVPCAQYFVDFYLWEAVLNNYEGLIGIVELGTFQGGFSRYLYAQAQARSLEFVTFDVIPADNPPPQFVKLDIYRYCDDVVHMAEGMGGPVALFCDGGNKPRELQMFPHRMPEGSIFLVHDWGTETLPHDVPDHLEEIFGAFCDEIGSATRVFQMKEEGSEEEEAEEVEEVGPESA